MGEDADEPQILNDWKARRDFSHLLAKDIYSENEVQIANTGSKALPQMQIVFLGSNPERGAGNRSTLMSSYYSLNKEFVSDPAPVWDDGTADFDPVMTASPAGWTYVVWKNALEPLEEGLSFSQIADKTELFIAEHQAGSSWYPGKQITNFSGTGKFAAGAKIGTDHDGEPVVVYYTNDISDPLGLNGTHEIYLASRRNGAWVSEKVTEITGTMNSVDCTDFGWGTAIAVSFEQDDKSYIALYRGTEKVWGREGASTAAFLGAGYRDVRLTWLQQGRLYQMAPDGTEKPLTPEDVQIPEGKYNLYGHIGNSSLMIVSTSLKDTSENAFAYYSKNGGTSWVKADLTDIDERASVSHISAAFTYENEPVLVYSVQHYDVNTDLDGLLEDPVAAAEKETGGTKSSLRFGNDDRFTDTRTDLYLKTRRMNSHAVLEDGKAENIENARLGSTLDFTVTVRNNGLYPIENGLILYKDSIVGMFHESIGLGESTEVHFSARLPEDAGDDLVMDFDLRTNEFRGVESTVSIPVDPGYLSVNKAAHLFTNGQESAGFVIENCGYSQKTCRIVAKDEAKDTVISEKTLTLSAGERRTESVDAENKLFVSDGCENVTVYILLGDEEPGDPKISPNRVFSFAPLEAVYGQSMEGLK